MAKPAVDESGTGGRSANQRLTALRSRGSDQPRAEGPDDEHWPEDVPIPVFGAEPSQQWRTHRVPSPRAPLPSYDGVRVRPPERTVRPVRDLTPPETPVERTSPLPVVSLAQGRLARLRDRWVPDSWRGSRVAPGRPAAKVLVLVAALAAVLAAVGVWRDRPVAQAPPSLAVVAPTPGTPTPSTSAPASSTTPSDGPAVVSVVGKVRKPGLVRLAAGSRVADAIGKAGGPLPKTDLTTVNLARRVSDGEQIVVGLPQPAVLVPPTGPVEGASAGPARTGKVDLNHATPEQFDGLPGVGPVTAQRIVDWRAKHGRFTAVEQLREIEGIGERRFGQLRDQVTI